MIAMALQIMDIGTAGYPNRNHKNGKMKKMEKIKLEFHLMCPDGTEHLYVKNKTLKYFYNLRDWQGFLRADTNTQNSTSGYI